MKTEILGEEIESAWDVSAIDEMGRPCEGITDPSPAGVQVEVFLNQLRVRCQTWNSRCGLPEPFVAVIQDGRLVYRDTAIIAGRGPRSGIYFACWYLIGVVPTGIVGISCRGQDKEGFWTGVTREQTEFMESRLRDWTHRGWIPKQFSGLSFASALRYNQGDRTIAAGIHAPVEVSEIGKADLPLVLQHRKIKPGEIPSPPPIPKLEENHGQ